MEVNNNKQRLKEVIHTNALKPVLETYCFKLERAINTNSLNYAKQYRELIKAVIRFADIVEKPIKNVKG